MTETPQQYHENFQKILDGLNPSQQEAVEAIEGPVLVIAGPGTGKTHILAARIGKILLETDSQPHNILCLTFTEAGVRSMRQRLIEFIGPEAHKLHIHTFHSFCNKIIRENLEHFGRKELEPISDLERVELLRSLIEELPLNHQLKQGRGQDVYYYIGHISNLFATMKSENWTPEIVSQKIDDYLRDLPLRDEFIYKRNSKDYKRGDLKKAQFEKESQKVEILRAAANLFPAFLEKMTAWQRYDFQDMVLWVLDAFAKNKALLRNYQEQYLYFLVDEFQDTNGAQNEILQNLISFWENPNVFIVGDDDQSIYEFQGARLKNLTDYFDQFRKDMKLVILKDNYRSSQTILDAARDLIGHNQIRVTSKLQELGLNKVLTARNADFANLAVKPIITKYPFRFHEIADIVAQIEQMKNEGFPLDEVAVIYAKHKQSHDLIEFFKKKNIPFNTRRKVNILDLHLIDQVRNIMQYLLAESVSPFSGEHQLYKILHFPFWEIEFDDLARISLFFAKKKISLSGKDAKQYYWRETIGRDLTLQTIGVENMEAILNASKVLRGLRKALNTLSLPHLIERILNTTGAMSWAIAQPDKAWHIQVLHSFLNFIKTEAARNPRIDLNRILEIFDNMDDSRLSLELQQIAQTEAGVNLLTAHGSKGLEFQRVFILDATKDMWEPSTRTANYKFKLPDTITFSGAEDEMEARRRLFYVAMTRAKEQLHISYSLQNNKSKDLSRAAFLDEILQQEHLTKVIEKQLPQAQILEAQTTLLSEQEIVKIESPNPAIIKELLADFRMSISALNNYLYCPVGFFYENILRVPSVQREAASYGTAIHETLEKLFAKMLTSKTKQFPKTQEVIKDFEFEMERWRGFFSIKSYDKFLRRGKFHLKEFYRKHHKAWRKAVKLEYRISNAEIDGVPVVGVIDRIEFLENQQVHIVDYKTSKPKPDHLRKITAKNKTGGNYWRQLIFYKLLFENYKNTERQVASAEIAYIEPDKSGDYPNPKFKFSAKEVDDVRALIKDSYAKIMNQEFYEGCSKPECNWCNFVRNQSTPETFSLEEIENLDDGA